MNEPKGRAMTTPDNKASFKDAIEGFEAKVAGRLHAYVKETREGMPAVSCIWNESPGVTYKDVVYEGSLDFKALAAVKAINQSMAASHNVVEMLIELYNSQSTVALGEGIEY
ncbi:hypothetical protein ACI77O_12080 [Pseudomonas tritici]|uniref:hypothetical protein n=1 Tax=Pseudomonas tritici TaxID=2745518 RepID=UPI00387B54FA